MKSKQEIIPPYKILSREFTTDKDTGQTTCQQTVELAKPINCFTVSGIINKDSTTLDCDGSHFNGKGKINFER